MPDAQGSENQVLRHLLGKEREPALTTPPVAGIAAARTEPATATVTNRREEARIAVRIFDGFVHGNDPPQTHGLDLLVRELFANQAGDVGIRLHEFHLIGLGADVLGDAVVVLEERTLEDDDLVRTRDRRLELFRTKHAFRVVSHPIAFRLRPRNPLVARRRLVERDREVDDAINFTPAPGSFGDRQFVTKETIGCFFATEFVDNRLKPIVRAMTVFGHDWTPSG